MDPNDARMFLREHHRAVLATTRTDGRVQMSPVATAVDGTGRVLVSTREAARKTHHLRARPYAALCVFTDAYFGEWLQLEGPVEIVSLPDAMGPLVDYYRLVAGEHPDWDDYREAMERERRVLLRLTIERAGPDMHG